MNALERHAKGLGQNGQHLAAAFPGALLIDGLGRRVLLNVHVPRVASIDVDGEGVLRHVGVVEPEALDALLRRPGFEAVEILAHAVGEHLRAGPRGPFRTRFARRRPLVVFGQIEPAAAGIRWRR